MLVNLSECFMSEGKTEAVQLAVPMTSFTHQGSVYEIQEKTPLILKLSNTGIGKVRVEGSMSLKLLLKCDRCLNDVPTDFVLAFDRQVYAPECLEEASGEGLSDDELDEQNFMEGYQLDVERLLNNEIFLNFPMKVLCREDCKGICKVCGKDLNTGDCGCDTFVPDPRMAKIKDIFQTGKEV